MPTKHHRSLGNMLVPMLFSFTILCLISTCNQGRPFNSDPFPGGGLGFTNYKALPGANNDFDDTRALLRAFSNEITNSANEEDPDDTDLPLIERLRRSINAMSRKKHIMAEDKTPKSLSPSTSLPIHPTWWPFDHLVSSSSFIHQAIPKSDSEDSELAVSKGGTVLHSWIQKSTALLNKVATKNHQSTISPTVCSKPRIAKTNDEEYAMVYCSDIRHAIVKTKATYKNPEGLSTSSSSMNTPNIHAPASRPRLSFYSPFPSGKNDLAKPILPPWEQDSLSNHGSSDQAIPSPQPTERHYHRIDVEVIGSSIVTREKFSQGLF